LSARPALARGDVVLVRFPFTDLSGLKLRPALIVGRVSGDDVVLAFVTSQTAPNQHRADVLLRAGDSEFVLAGLRVSSRVRLDRLVTLSRGLVIRRLGRIGPQTNTAVSDALRYVFEL